MAADVASGPAEQTGTRTEHRSGGPLRLGPVAPTASALGVLSPLPFDATTITGGFWADRQRINREESIAAAWAHLHEAGNFDDLALAAAHPGGGHRAEYRGPWFMDTDVNKWLEGSYSPV